jgi:hypothetical protein
MEQHALKNSFARLPNAIGIKARIVLTRISRGGATGLNQKPVPATTWQHGSQISFKLLLNEKSQNF